MTDAPHDSHAPRDPLDRELLAIYEQLKQLAARDDTPPCVDRNVKKALACFWQIANDLDLAHEQLYDLGV